MLAEVMAYPVLLGAIYGVLRVGRHEGSRLFEWVRLTILAALIGFVMAFQVRLIVMGAIQSAVTLAAGILSLAGVVVLVGMHLFERRAARAGPAS